MGFVNRLLHTSGLPLTHRQFWQYSFLYWSFFSVIWLGQSIMVWLLTPNGRMYYTETLYWFIEMLYWWAATPLIIYFAQRFSLQNHRRLGSLIQQLLIHLFIVSVLYAIQLAFEYTTLSSVTEYEQGKSVTLRRVVTVFFLSYGTAFSQYMLLVVSYNVLTYIYQFQSLRQQHLQAELANEQLQSQLVNAQLQSLKMQLNPHFLFNTLHTVVSLMLRDQTRRAALMVTTLSDLLRGVLARQHANFIPLRDELQLTKQYLAIQQIRFQDRLTIEYDIANDAEDCSLPQLILQPLVENAVTHGIADLTEGAIIRITARKWADSLLIDVFDNGLGINQLHHTSGTGLGLPNTLSRLQQAYGDAAQLRFDQPPSGTTTVSLLIPCQHSLPKNLTHDALQHTHHR